MPTAPIAERKPATHLENHLRADLFIPELKAKKKLAVLEELTAHLAERKVTRHPEAVLEVLRQREALGSTGIGKGIAIPHGRSTMVAERAVLFARSSRGIDFEAADSLPVHLCFLIVAPPMEQDPIYLRLLADIVKSVRLARARQRLLEAPDFESVREILTASVARE
ncbi:MAG: PTS sugar transporter subunit IIA [Candidatus Latescibacteria bacterium]|nr:PTS sugar transporter subunit IIA [Candidatus Latescibacterota bacterium]